MLPLRRIWGTCVVHQKEVLDPASSRFFVAGSYFSREIPVLQLEYPSLEAQMPPL